MIELLVFPVLAGLALALSVGPLGSFVVWRKMSYFGDTLAHSGLLGVALGLLLNITPAFSTILVSLVVASLLVFLQQRSYLANDTILGILSHTSLAIGLICISIFPERLVNLNAYLIGDFLTVSQHEFWPILAVSLGCFATVVWRWKRLLAVTVDADLAKLEGCNPELNRLVLTLLTALLIAVAVRVVGVLLITALLIIPGICCTCIRKVTRANGTVGIVYCCIFGTSGYRPFGNDKPAGWAGDNLQRSFYLRLVTGWSSGLNKCAFE